MGIRGPKPSESRINNGILEKCCSKCDKFKPLSEYHQRVTGFLGVRSQCKECEHLYSSKYQKEKYVEDEEFRNKIHEYNKNYYKRNKDKLIEDSRTYVLKNKYNLTREEYEKLCENGCHSCGKTDTKFCVDHNHITGTIRGILCSGCNTALGLLRDDVNCILKLAYYLEERSKVDVPL